MRAAGAGEHDVKGVSDKGDIGCAADQTASIRARLAGGKIVYYRRAKAVVIDLGNARACDCCLCRVLPPADLHAAANCRVRSADSPFGHIKVAIRPKFQAARIIQSGGKDRDGTLGESRDGATGLAIACHRAG